MRSSSPIWFLSTGAAMLLAANWYVRRPLASSAEATTGQINNTSSVATEKLSLVEKQLSADKPSSVATTSSSRAAALDWAAIETADYKQYAANLRAIGFPEALVRAIVIADINALYAPREEPLKPKPVPHDAPL